MSDVKISQFPYVGNTGYTPTDLLVFVNYLNPTGTTSNTKIDDVKDYVIIDSYNYFLPLSGGTVTGSTSFTNGINTNIISATTYQNLPDNVTGFYLPLSGGTVTGSTSFTNGLNVNTISATTYQNLPIDPDTYVTGFTYSDNVFTIKQNNGQPDLTQTINIVTGLTVNGNLNITGNTSAQGLTATTFSSSTINVANTTGTPNQVTSFDITGKLVAGAGQSTSSSFGSSTLTVTNTTTTFTILPGTSQTITVPSNCFAIITADGGVNTTSTTTTSIASVDIAIFIDGSFPTNGGYRRVSAHNPSGTAINSTGVPWSITTTATLSPGSHTIDVRAVYTTGSNMSVSSNNTNSRQAGLYITLIKL